MKIFLQNERKKCNDKFSPFYTELPILLLRFQPTTLRISTLGILETLETCGAKHLIILILVKFVKMNVKSASQPELWQLARNSSGYRELLLGTSKLATVLCTNLHLSPGTTLTSCHYIYKFWSKFDILETDRKFIAAAAVLLSWKVREDIEPTRSSRKLSELSRFLYRIIKANSLSQVSSAPIPLELSSSFWIYKDSGKEYTHYMEQIKTYEFALLRAINFDLVPIELPFSHIERFTRILLYSPKLNEYVEEGEEGEEEGKEFESLKMFRLLASTISQDFYRLPNVCMQYNALEVSLCSVWYAGIFLSMSFAYEEISGSNQSWISKACPEVNAERVVKCMDECSKVLIWLINSDSA
ncbi:Cyclin-like [Cryptosporidium tyzzeri]|nr:Cyclin-like [Cryptosporidium tyzzeri]